jgi:hypothetical protein
MRAIGFPLAVVAISVLGACGSSSSTADPVSGDASTDTFGTDTFGTDTSGTDTSGPAVSADQACADLAAAYCDRSFACALLFSDVTYGDATTCKTRLKASCLGSLSAPGVAETPEMTAACAKAVVSSTCDDLLAKKPIPACVPAPGAVADGGACGDREQCASGFCAYATDSICGVCAAMPKAGDPCVNNQCCPDMNCVAATNKCQKPTILGEACSSRDMPCAPGLSCFGGKCVRGGTAGAKCDKVEVDDPDCDGTQGVFCNTTTKVCQKALEAKAGETCGLSGSDFKLCVGGAVCKVATGTFSGTCIAPAADGAACSAGSDGPGCLQPAYCIGSVCKLADAKSCTK